MKQPKWKPLEWEFEPLPWSKEGVEKEQRKQTEVCPHNIPKAQCQECQIVCIGCG